MEYSNQRILCEYWILRESNRNELSKAVAENATVQWQLKPSPSVVITESLWSHTLVMGRFKFLSLCEHVINAFLSAVIRWDICVDLLYSVSVGPTDVRFVASSFHCRVTSLSRFSPPQSCFEDLRAISYPNPQQLASGWPPGETLGNWKKFYNRRISAVKRRKSAANQKLWRSTADQRAWQREKLTFNLVLVTGPNAVTSLWEWTAYQL